MESTKIIFEFKSPIKVLIPKQIHTRLVNYILEWEERSIPNVMEFILQDNIIGYEIKLAIIKIGTLEDPDNYDKIFHFIYDKENKLDITLELYEYNGNNLILVVSNLDGNKTISDVRSYNELNISMDRIITQTKEFDKFLEDIIADS